MNPSLSIFLNLLVLIFIGFSVYSIIIWLKSTPKLGEILKDHNKHWSLKFVIYYGMFFAMFLVFVVFLSLTRLLTYLWAV